MSDPSVMKPLPTSEPLHEAQMKQSLCQWRSSKLMNRVPPIPAIIFYLVISPPPTPPDKFIMSFLCVVCLFWFVCFASFDIIIFVTEPIWYLDGIKVNNVSNIDILGVNFSSSCNYNDHVNTRMIKCKRSIFSLCNIGRPMSYPGLNTDGDNP